MVGFRRIERNISARHSCTYVHRARVEYIFIIFDVFRVDESYNIFESDAK